MYSTAHECLDPPSPFLRHKVRGLRIDFVGGSARCLDDLIMRVAIMTCSAIQCFGKLEAGPYHQAD
jgi:hypothetical protein